MKVKFWGTRGEIVTPGQATLRYGGNTSCVEVLSSNGTLVILDAGSGLKILGTTLTSSQNGSLLITHTHWDHIQGIPFFFPLFDPNNQWDIYAPKGLEHSIRETLVGEMQYQGFPSVLEQLGASIEYHELVVGEFFIDDILIKTFYLNHPALTLGYRLEADGVSLVYCCDHEPYTTELAEGKPVKDNKQNNRLINFLQDADLAICDAQYTMKEYQSKKGWGHGTIEYVAELCRSANVTKLALSHHDPSRDDASIDREVALIQKKMKEQSSSLEIFAACEGLVLTLKSTNKPFQFHPMEGFSALSDGSHNAQEEQSVLLVTANHMLADILSKYIIEGNVRCRWEESGQSAILSINEEVPSLVILENLPPKIDASTLFKQIEHQGYEVPIIAIVKNEEESKTLPKEISGYLVAPFSAQYAKSFIHSWLLRNIHRWQRPPFPAFEANRVADLKDLKILDTTFEERFDRLTRIASLYFDVPIALISFIDLDRQWFKSYCGITTQETSREASFCAHMILTKQPLVVPDTLTDDRFAENPAVIGPPYIRFYAGQPLITPRGNCVGSFCILDIRPRHLDQKNLDILGDFRDLAMQEILRK